MEGKLRKRPGPGKDVGIKVERKRGVSNHSPRPCVSVTVFYCYTSARYGLKNF